MRAPLASPHARLRRLAPVLTAFVAAALMAGCASMGGASDDPTAALKGAEVYTRSIENGDTVEEYRVGGQLRAVKLTPSRRPAYYLEAHDRDRRHEHIKGEGAPRRVRTSHTCRIGVVPSRRSNGSRRRF